MLTPVPPDESVFAPGAVLGDRFEIVRAIGAGGMGAVYEAIDYKLDRRVALKCARRGHRLRLTPEVRAAREVSHFNVCKVHDVHTFETPSGEIDCLSMEFIEGPTIAQQIATSGRFTPGAAREIALQICAGLGQAHRQGVIHGDLKSSNVILARSPEGHLRAVIMDFGLARIEGELRPDTVSGGTADYMAPEVMMGELASVASDLYSLGVLFHEMLAGRPPGRPSKIPPKSAPWTPDSQADTLIAALPDADWRRDVAPLPAPWRKIVASCLSVAPAGRPASAGVIARMLEPRRILFKVALAVLGGVALLAAGNLWRTPAPETPVRLAVLPFAVDGGDGEVTAAIGGDVAERLAGARNRFTVISPHEAERNHAVTPQAVHNILGATHALETHIRIADGTMVTQASLVDLQSGATIGKLNGNYPSGDTPTLAKALVGTVTEAFHLPAGAPRETVADAAYPYYIRAVDLLRIDHSNAELAIPLLNKAIALDPRSALPYAGLAEAQIQRMEAGDRSQFDAAEAAAAKAASINPDAVPVLLASSYIAQERGRYERAIQLLTRAAQIAPSDPEPLRRLALCYERAGRPDDAVAAYQRAIHAKPDYYRPHLTLGTFYLNRGEFERAEREYRLALHDAPGLESGHMNLGLVLMQQRRYPEAEKELLTTLRLRRTPNLLLNLGSLYYAEEDFQKAADFYAQSLAEGPASSVLLRNLGDARRHLGQAAEAKAAYSRARQLAETDVKLNPRRAASHVILGLLDAYLGDSEHARFELSQALALGPEVRSVMRDAAMGYEFMGQRNDALAAIHAAPRSLLEELAHQPDLQGLAADVQFKNLLSNTTAQ